jgi:hypothetical protein
MRGINWKRLGISILLAAPPMVLTMWLCSTLGRGTWIAERPFAEIAGLAVALLIYSFYRGLGDNREAKAPDGLP